MAEEALHKDRLLPLCRGVLLFQDIDSPLKNFYYHTLETSSSWHWNDPQEWGVQKEPRSVVVTDVSGKGQKFRLIYDVQGLPTEVRELLPEGHLLHDHDSCIIIELRERDRSTHPLENWKSLCELLWLGLESGAKGIYFPESQMSLTPDVALSIEPWMLTPEHLSMFIRVGVAGAPETSEDFYVRTFGMSQFGLPDLIASVEKKRSDLESALLDTKRWLEAVPQTLVEHYSIVPEGEDIALADHEDVAFRRQQPPSEIKGLTSPFGLHYFEAIV